MELFSCHNCGVVLDAERLSFMYRYELDDDKISYISYSNQDDFMTTCPVCKSIITKDGDP